MEIPAIGRDGSSCYCLNYTGMTQVNRQTILLDKFPQDGEADPVEDDKKEKQEQEQEVASGFVRRCGR